MIPVLWSVGQSCFETDWISELLNNTGYQYQYIFPSEDGQIEIPNVNCIVVANHAVNYRAILSELRKRGLYYFVILLSDELIKEKTEYLNDDHCVRIARNYVQPWTLHHPKVFTFGLGYKNGFCQDAVEPPKPMPKRIDHWCFAGSVHHADRVHAINVFSQLEPHRFHKTSHFNSPDGLETIEYREMLVNAKFALCPMGHINNDSFRICEVLEAGAIPVVLASAPHLPLQPSYWHFLFEKENLLPFVIGNTWDECYSQVLALLKQTDKIQKTQADCIYFWKKWKKIWSQMFARGCGALMEIGIQEKMHSMRIFDYHTPRRKKIAFHSNWLGLRGVEVALYDYAFYNRAILGNDSFILSQADGDLSALDKFQKQFDVFLYRDFKEVISFVDQNKIDSVYYAKAGINDQKLVPNARNLVHAVFQIYQPHGEIYAYISEWLSLQMSDGKAPYVPYMVDILKYDHRNNYRVSLNIPNNALVFGYYGGADCFGIDFAKQCIFDVASANNNIYFLFMNVDPFCAPLPNVIFLKGTSEISVKIGFINTCDACLHSRINGESFGLTVAEFSVKNKPVITSSRYFHPHLNDLAHLHMLGDKAITYHDYDSLKQILINFFDIKRTRENWNAYAQYNPHDVMQKFKEVFLI